MSKIVVKSRQSDQKSVELSVGYVALFEGRSTKRQLVCCVEAVDAIRQRVKLRSGLREFWKDADDLIVVYPFGFLNGKREVVKNGFFFNGFSGTSPFSSTSS